MSGVHVMMLSPPGPGFPRPAGARLPLPSSHAIRATCHRHDQSLPLPCKDENGTEISRTDRFRFLYYGSVFKHKNLSVSIDFTTIFNHFFIL
jgi:hypothetical protein